MDVDTEAVPALEDSTLSRMMCPGSSDVVLCGSETVPWESQVHQHGNRMGMIFVNVSHIQGFMTLLLHIAS